MLQEILDMVKIFDQAPGTSGGDRRGTLQDLLAYLHQANGATNPAALLERQAADKRLRDAAVASGFATNFEEILAQHVAFNSGKADNRSLLDLPKRSAKAAAAAATAERGDAADDATGSADSESRHSNLSVTIPEEWIEEIVADEQTMALFRSIGPIDGVSVEFHRIEEAIASSRKKSSNQAKKAQSGPAKATSTKNSSQAAAVVVAASKRNATETTDDNAVAASVADTECDMPLDVEEEVVVHEEDLQQISHMISTLQPLSMQTLEELSKEWDVSFPNGGEHNLYRTNITERIRYLAATMVVGVADRFQVLQNTHTNSQDAERERLMLVNNLVLSLWHGINVLTESVRKNFAVIFGLEADSTAHDVCVAVAGLGIAAFFEPLPLPLIEKVCRELNLPPLDPKTDPDLLNEAMAHQICTHFYPVLGKLDDMNLQCTTNLKVHENGPGSYTCTIDNALLMDLIMRQAHTSNKFSCSKVKWRARVEVRDGTLSFSVWHRDSRTFHVTLVLRTSEKAKKKKPGETAAQVATGGLYLEKKDVAAPATPVGFRDIVSLQNVYRNLTTTPNGLRLYNRAEDRIIFQFSMEITPVDVSSAAPISEHVEPHTEPAAAAVAQAVSNGKAAGGKGKQAATPADAGQTIAELIEQEEREKREKAAAKAKQKNDKRFKQLEQTETQAREAILSQYATAANQLHLECQKSYTKAMQKKKDRERKQELAKATPNVELQAQLAAIEQVVRTARQAFSKLMAEKTKEEKEVSALRQQLEAHQAELQALEATSEENTATLEDLAKQIEEQEALNEQRRKKLEAKAERRSRRKPSGLGGSRGSAAFGADDAHASAQSHNTLSIQDLHSFWDISATSVPTSSSSVALPSGGPMPHLSGMTGLAGGSAAIGGHIGPSMGGSGLGGMSSGSNALNMGLDLGAFAAPIHISAPQQQVGPSMGVPHGYGGMSVAGRPNTMGVMNPGFGLNGDAQPFYGSSFVDGNFGQPKMNGAPPMHRNVPFPTPMGGMSPSPSGGPTFPGGFSPYGMPMGAHHNRMPSPGTPSHLPSTSPLLHNNVMHGAQHRPPVPGGQVPQQPQQQPFAPSTRPMYARPAGGFGFNEGINPSF